MNPGPLNDPGSEAHTWYLVRLVPGMYRVFNKGRKLWTISDPHGELDEGVL